MSLQTGFPAGAELVARLSRVLDLLSSVRPTVVVSPTGHTVTARYAYVDIEIAVEPAANGVMAKSEDMDKLAAPTLLSALSFIVGLEARRQKTDAPVLQFANGSGR